MLVISNPGIAVLKLMFWVLVMVLEISEAAGYCVAQTS